MSNNMYLLLLILLILCVIIIILKTDKNRIKSNTESQPLI